MGWQWFLCLARQHDVVLLTHAYFRPHIEPALRQAGLEALEVHYHELALPFLHPDTAINSRAYYTAWQWHVRGRVRRLLRERHFDLIHHITWATLRFPCLLGGLGVPLVMGPLGGGEVAPLRLFSGLPLKVRVYELLRSASLLLVRVDPLATWGPRRSALVLCKTDDSLRAMPASVRSRTVIASEIGSPPVKPSVGPRPGVAEEPRRFRLLFAGRLLGLKGVTLALGAVGRLVQRGLDVEFDIVGDGPMRAHLERQVQTLGLHKHVKLLGGVTRDQMLDLYGGADLFVFPSLHDSGGTVVLESLSRGLPVVCLDLGGPKYHLDDRCGAVVCTAGLNTAQVEQALADVIAALYGDRQRLAAMARQAVVHAERHSWEAIVQRAYGHIERRLQWSAA